MSVLVGRQTRVLVQGMGKHGLFHAKGCRDYGTEVVGGVTPGKGGTTVEGFPLFDTVEEAVRKTGANCSMVFVPPAGAADAVMEAAEAGIPLVVCITEGIPTLDMVKVHAYLAQRKGTRLVGPNCPGVISPGERCKVGIMPGHIHRGGSVGVISRSGTLTYEAVAQLTALGVGQTTCIGIGGDPIIGTNHTEAIRLLNDDAATEAIVMIGEIGGSAEEEAAAFVAAARRASPSWASSLVRRHLRADAWDTQEPSSPAARERPLRRCAPCKRRESASSSRPPRSVRQWPRLCTRRKDRG